MAPPPSGIEGEEVEVARGRCSTGPPPQQVTPPPQSAHDSPFGQKSPLPQQMPPLGAQVPSLQSTGNPGGQVGHPVVSGAHQPLLGQQVVPSGQHEPLHECAHAQMPAPPWQPPVAAQLESPQQ